jgi:hypothetical protein
VAKPDFKLMCWKCEACGLEMEGDVGGYAESAGPAHIQEPGESMGDMSIHGGWVPAAPAEARVSTPDSPNTTFEKHLARSGVLSMPKILAGKAEQLSPDLRQAPGATTSDPWAHRSAGMKCRTCMWFSLKGKPLAVPGERGNIGRCRKHAPTMGGFPVVFEADWCGDHRLDETKA